MAYASPVSEGKKHYVRIFRYGGSDKKAHKVHIYRHTSLKGMTKSPVSVHVHNLGTFRRILQAMPEEDREVKDFYKRKFNRYYQRLEELCKRYDGVLASYHGLLEQRNKQEQDVVDDIAHEIKHITLNLKILRRKTRKTWPLEFSDNVVAASAMADTQRYLDMMKKHLDFLESFDNAGIC